MQTVRSFRLTLPLLISLATVLWFASLIPARASQTATCHVPSVSHATIQSAVSDPGCDTVNQNRSLHVENVTITHYAYLPVKIHDLCLDFIDDFSSPGSGWFVGEDDFVRSEYLSGEYRILTRRSGFLYLFRAPACPRENYEVEVDARWVGPTGSSYGLIFGLNDDYSRYYLFDMNTDFQQFRVLRRDPGGFVVVVPISGSPAINGGNGTNHLKVTRNGSQITLEVNGTALGTWFDGAISGSTAVGLVSSPYSNRPVSDARFDNFSVTTLGNASAGFSDKPSTAARPPALHPALNSLVSAPGDWPQTEPAP